MKYKSQYSQDKFLHENYFKNIENGFFIDIGASEPENQNNTYFFEQIGWKGVLIEPRIKEFENLKNNRKAPVENVAIYKESGQFKFLSCDGYIKGLSGLLCEQKPEHLNRIFNELLQYGKSIEVIEIQTMTFWDLVKKYNCYNIDYLSLDVEGAEISILKTIDFNKIKIKTISVENNYQSNEIYNILSANNFAKVVSLGCDDIYVNNFL